MSAAAFAAAMGCSSERSITNTKRTAMEQLVASEATDRAVRRVRWPRLPGRRVFVEVASPAAAAEQAYLKAAVTAELSRRGAVPVEKPDGAELVATILAGSLGTEQTKRFFGVPAMQSLAFPLSIPEMPIYRSIRQTGYAKLEVVIRDPASRSVVFYEGPRSGEAYWTEYSFLAFGFYRTDTSRRPPGIVPAMTNAGRSTEPR